MRILIVLLGVFTITQSRAGEAAATATPTAPTTTMGRCSAIVAAYQACHEGLTFDKKTGFVSLSPFLGRIPCSDNQNLPFYERLDHADFASQLSIEYRRGEVPLPETRVNADGGRIRLDPFFMSVYGSSAIEVRKNLVSVNFLNQSVKFNGKNGAASALAAVGSELMIEMKKDERLRKYLQPWLEKREDLNNMTFNWRKVAPTNRLSNHSFGAAIDLNDPHPHGPVYWLWSLASERQKRIQDETGKHVPIGEILKTIHEDQTGDFHPHTLSAVPPKLVEIFEKHGFIWGGKWFHFDAMHFEYRPEFFPNLKPICLMQTPNFDAASSTGESVESSKPTDWRLDDFHWD